LDALTILIKATLMKIR